jgi:voltage-gated potassium channel
MLTTVGYGDIYPITTIGRLISMISSLVGVAVIALPSGVITAGYLDEIRERRERKLQSEKQESQKPEKLEVVETEEFLAED